MKRILVINGPNLNMLGVREKNIYGEKGLDWIQRKMEEEGKRFKFSLTFFQSNHEGEIIDKIQEGKNFDGIIINPGGYSHTSVSIMDAIRSIDTPVIEVHISNVFKREEFRHRIITGRAANGIITGLGYVSYLAALYALYIMLNGETIP